MIGFVVFVLVVIGTVYVLKARRASTLAGRVAERPVYSVEPPTRRMGSRKGEAL